ncbi:MAG TPA: xanthine dehydrogenase family protein molybdopterin-binding subunit [Terriglobales bacterium]|jgi:isoquinoline 1-oxidoreductase beta subunit|nr:xanthine dehydrogenase family protein molybdopterin-binding subunit [Terriglobales bacterium]
MNSFAKVNRRDFMKVTGAGTTGLILALYLPQKLQAAADEAASFQPNAWLNVTPDDKVKIWVAKSEMGQGCRTGLPMIVAEELDADWKTVEVVPAILDPRYGNQGTGGSRSVRSGFKQLREAGAAGRAMLIAAAAEKWGVSADTCHASNGEVVHRPSGRRLRYGALASLAAKQALPKQLTLKDPKDFRIIGKSMPRTDVPDKTDGKAEFGIDVRVPGMLYGSIAKCPVFGGKVASFDAAKTKAMRGVKGVYQVPSGVAVVADSSWRALEGRNALNITWDEGPNAKVSSAGLRKQYAELAQNPGIVQVHAGEPAQALDGAAKKVEAVYEVPFLAHATMEPMNCTADVRADSAEIWSPTQAPSWVQEYAMKATGLPASKIKVNITLLGSGFGRRAMPDFSHDAIDVSKSAGAPVKVLWTREDDMHHDFYRPLSYHKLSGGLDAQGNPVVWTHRVVAASISAYNFGPLKDGKDQSLAEGTEIPYAIPNVLVDYHVAPDNIVPVGWWRSVYNTQTAYANECFMDELAAAAGRDPVDFRLKLLPEHSSHRSVLQLAAEKAGWGKPLAGGRTRGAAVHNSFGSTVAEIAEVSVEKNEVKVHRVVCAVDCGIAINPDSIEAQVQGAIVLGLGAALKGEITVENGRVQQDNFNDYPVLMADEMPEVEVYILPSTEPPQGIGEPGTPPITPAVCNAIFAATKKPVRQLPIRLGA